MATRTRTTNRIATPATVTYSSKSDHARTLFRAGKSVTEVAAELGIGYAFAYGIAKRADLAETAAARRKPAGSKFAALVSYLDPAATPELIAEIVTGFGRGATSPVKPVRFARIARTRTAK
jgi:hypothetical protein